MGRGFGHCQSNREMFATGGNARKVVPREMAKQNVSFLLKTQAKKKRYISCETIFPEVVPSAILT